MGLRVPEHYQCRNYDSHPCKDVSLPSQPAYNSSANLSWAGEAPVTRGRVRLGRSGIIATTGKDGCEEFRQRKSRARQSCSSRHTSRESTTQWRLRSIKARIFFLLTSVYNVHRSVRELTITLLFSCGGAASVFGMKKEQHQLGRRKRMGTLEHQVPGPSIFKVSLYAGVDHTRSPRVTQKNSRGQRSSKGHV